METQSPGGVPDIQSCTWSMAALAAEAALEAPRASMIAAPRCCTVGMKSPSSHAWSSITAAAVPPGTSQWTRSGYWVAEWLPQMVIRDTSLTLVPSFWATWVRARLWSRRIMAVKRSSGTSGALFMAIRQFVLAGLPITRTRRSSAAWSFRERPWPVKMAPLASSRSWRSMPLDRGREPTRRATFAPLKAVPGSSLNSRPARSGKAQSSSSIATPSRAPMAGGISRSWRTTGWSGPSMAPLAIRKTRL